MDTTGPFAGFLIPLFAWLARQESIRKGKAVKLGMEKAKAEGRNVGRQVVVDMVDADLVVRLRSEGRSWREDRRGPSSGEVGQEKGKAQRGVDQEGGMG